MSSKNYTNYACALSDKQILEARDAGDLVIFPFEPTNLQTSSYDVTLGDHYYRESKPGPGSGDIYNPYDQVRVQQVWGNPIKAVNHSQWAKTCSPDKKMLANIGPDDYIIWIKPGETILAHTNEFIGGMRQITTMMKARSSMGRNFISVCKCAGWGDVGYINRWTMEISNSSHYDIPLVVGRRIAQIVFIGTGQLLSEEYHVKGKYQDTDKLDGLVEKWSPNSMLPKMYLDKEIVYSIKDLIEPTSPPPAVPLYMQKAITCPATSSRHESTLYAPSVLKSSSSNSQLPSINNPVGALQELLQGSRFTFRPTYMEVEGEHGGNRFTIECSLPSPFGHTTRGSATTKKQAKQNAASKMIQHLKQFTAKN